MKKRKSGFTAKYAVIIAALFLIANIILGIVLINESRDALKTLIHNRMLDISNTAADMINGDDLKSLKKEDKGTGKYQKINDTLAVFQDNIDLKYIYCIKPIDDTHFVFRSTRLLRTRVNSDLPSYTPKRSPRPQREPPRSTTSRTPTRGVTFTAHIPPCLTPRER